MGFSDGGVPQFTFFIYDHLGNSRILYTTQLVDCDPDKTKYLLEHVIDYYPYGKTLREFVFVRERFQTTYHERDGETGLDYRGARFYDGDVCRFLSADPLAAKYAGWSSYNYVLGNPIMFIDPDGRSVKSTIVTANDDGTYKVVSGNPNDGDNGIYLMDWESGEVGLVGYSATPESFYNSENDAGWMGTIDPTDQSGRNFLNNTIVNGDPNVVIYMSKSTGGEIWDFKKTEGTEGVKFETTEEHYRGMPILDGKNGKPIFASARDVGNIAAGLVAGREGIPWVAARVVLDGLQSFQEGRLSSEMSGTQYGQKLGHRIGRQMFEQEAGNLQANGHFRNIIISKDVIKKGDL